MGLGMPGNTAAGSFPGEASHSTSSQGESCRQQRHMHLQGSFPSTAVPEAAKEENGMSKDMPSCQQCLCCPTTMLISNRSWHVHVTHLRCQMQTLSSDRAVWCMPSD